MTFLRWSGRTFRFIEVRGPQPWPITHATTIPEQDDKKSTRRKITTTRELQLFVKNAVDNSSFLFEEGHEVHSWDILFERELIRDELRAA